MSAITLAGTVGILFWGPFAAVLAYYLFAVLRPQFLWQWALPPGIAWSEFVAVAAIIGGIGTALGISSSVERDSIRKLAGLHVVVGAFALWIGVAYVTAQYPDTAWIWFLEYLKIFTMFGIAAMIVVKFWQVRLLYLVSTVSLIYIAYEINFTYLINGRLNVFQSGYGGLDNNGAGLMLAMGVPLALYAWEATTQKWRWIFAAGLPLLLHAVLMTYSRGAMLSLIVATPVLVFRSRRRRQVGAAMVVLIAILPILAGPEIRTRFFSVQQYETDRSANSRLETWQAAIRIANDYPIFGVGIRNASYFSYRYGADMQGRTIHSTYFQTLADTGYPGLTLYLLVLSTSWFSLRRTRRLMKARTDAEAASLRSLVSGLEGALVVFAVGGAFLALEVFELPYVILLLAGQSWVVARASQAANVPVPGAISPMARIAGLPSPVGQAR